MSNKYQWILLSVVCVILSVVVYVNSHTEQVMSVMADYYFHKNDTSNAIKYYENSFELGNNSKKARDTYVNIIINSPLDTDMQDRLVKFVKLGINDEAQYKAEQFLYDIRREIHRKYPDNYITQAVHNQKVVRWSKNPITYGYTNIEIAPDYYKKEIESAINEWEKASDHAILFSEAKDNPSILIRFNSANPADEEDKKYVVAYTTPSIHANKLNNMIIDFYVKDPAGNDYTPNQVYNTALHELVHALGFMGHSNSVENVMYLTRTLRDVAKDTRAEITKADINTLMLLYVLKPDITVGSEKEVNNAKIKEAKIYIKKASKLPSGYMDLAEGYVAAKDYKKAVKCLEKALTFAETNDVIGMVYYNLAVTYYYMADYDNALDYVAKSMKIRDSEDCHQLLAEIYTADGSKIRAINEYEKLIKANPNNIEYTIALANIYVRSYKYLAARKVLKNYIKRNPSERNNIRFAPYGIIKFAL